MAPLFACLAYRRRSWRKEAALKEGRRAIELLPAEKDSVNGSLMIQFFAVTAAWTGEKDLALEQLELRIHNHPAGIAYLWRIKVVAVLGSAS